MEANRITQLARALSGRGSVEEEALPRYMPEELARRLCLLPDAAFDAYAFSREPLNRKLTPAQQAQLGERARSCGEEEARRLLIQYPGKSAEEICRILGLNVLRKAMPADGGRVLYAQFVQPDKITVFTHCISTAAPIAREDGPLSWLRAKRLEQVLLAHELYHALEERDPTLFSRAYRLRLWSMGPLHNDSPLIALGEIAGMAFARTLTGLPFSPYALEVLLCWGYHAPEACNLCDEILSYQEEGNSCLYPT